MNLSDRAEILNSLEDLSGDELPSQTKKIQFVQRGQALRPQAIQNLIHRRYVETAIANFESQVDREEIEQSQYSAFGESVFVSVALLVSCDESVVHGASLRAFQDGRDQDGLAGDINWSAQVRFDENAEALRDAKGALVDDLRFDWTGH
jgi:hypothetical protein